MKCRATIDGKRCKGKIESKSIKFISVFKYSGKCSKCGRNHFIPRALKLVQMNGTPWDKPKFTDGIRV